MNLNPYDNFNTAIHEAGHSVCASHFKIPSYPEVLIEGRSVVTQTTYPDTAGLCTYDEGRIPPLQFAIISWGGQLAQCLYATPPSWAPQYRPAALLLKDWFDGMMVQLKKFSPTDRLGILADYRRSWRACRSAFRIVRKNRARIIRLAKNIGGRIEKLEPMPEKFPAPLSDFIRLVVAGDGTTDPDEKFRALIQAQAKIYFAESQLQFDTPEQEQDGIAQWSAARLAKWQQGFADADTWQNMARAFRAWTKAKNSTEQIP